MPAPSHPRSIPSVPTRHTIRPVRAFGILFSGAPGPWPEVPCLGLRSWVQGAGKRENQRGHRVGWGHGGWGGGRTCQPCVWAVSKVNFLPRRLPPGSLLCGPLGAPDSPSTPASLPRTQAHPPNRAQVPARALSSHVTLYASQGCVWGRRQRREHLEIWGGAGRSDRGRDTWESSLGPARARGAHTRVSVCISVCTWCHVLVSCAWLVYAWVCTHVSTCIRVCTLHAYCPRIHTSVCTSCVLCAHVHVGTHTCVRVPKCGAWGSREPLHSDPRPLSPHPSPSGSEHAPLPRQPQAQLPGRGGAVTGADHAVRSREPSNPLSSHLTPGPLVEAAPAHTPQAWGHQAWGHHGRG